MSGPPRSQAPNLDSILMSEPLNNKVKSLNTQLTMPSNHTANYGVVLCVNLFEFSRNARRTCQPKRYSRTPISEKIQIQSGLPEAKESLCDLFCFSWQQARIQSHQLLNESKTASSELKATRSSDFWHSGCKRKQYHCSSQPFVSIQLPTNSIQVVTSDLMVIE